MILLVHFKYSYMHNILFSNIIFDIRVHTTVPIELAQQSKLLFIC